MTEFITRCYGKKKFEIIIKTDDYDHYEAAQTFARQLIDHAKPVTDNNVGCNWIPVTERLPGENKGDPYYEDDFFLVAFTGIVRSHDCDGFMFTAEYCGSGIWHDAITGEDITEGVTHWMPLPEPPKGV